MPRLWAVVALAVLATAPATVRAAAPTADRLTRFAELGRVLATADEASPPVDTGAALAELFALADAEIVENLRSGEPFAAPGFIQERLDTFMSAWGGAGFRVHRLGGAPPAGPLTIGVFTIPGPAPRGSVRAYGRGPGGEVELLAAMTQDGVPELHAWPAARSGAVRLAATWLGAPTGLDGRPLVVEVYERGRSGQVERIWSTAAAFPDGLRVIGFALKGGVVTIHHEARYPGRTSGCAGQTELVDVVRVDPRRDTPAVGSRRVLNAWHRDLHAAVGRLLDALAAGQSRVVAELVPDRAQRARLPRALTLDPTCEEAGPGAARSAVVAATEERAGRMVPWSLSWRRAAGGWRLTAAAPMLQ